MQSRHLPALTCDALDISGRGGVGGGVWTISGDEVRTLERLARLAASLTYLCWSLSKLKIRFLICCSFVKNHPLVASDCDDDVEVCNWRILFQ